MHLMPPYFDGVSQKWVSFCCSFYNMSHPFSRSMTIGTATYNSSVISCVLVDMTKLMDYKLAVNNSKVLVPPSADQTMLSISNSYMIVADNNFDRVLFMPKSLSLNYNYTSLFTPDLVRYTGFRSEDRRRQLVSLDQGTRPPVNFTENLVIDPLDPSLVDSVQIHVRTINASNKGNQSYIIRSIVYFNMEDLTASKSVIEKNIDAAQYQITFLALIVIVIICAVVICIAFQ